MYKQFILDSLKAVIGSPTRHSLPGHCSCKEVIKQIATGSIEARELRTRCTASEHNCYCKIGGATTFADLVRGCRADIHQCICHIIVLPSVYGTREWISSMAVEGGEYSCMANHYLPDCVCGKKKPDSCPASRHDCICQYCREKICRFVPEDAPKRREHGCTCQPDWFNSNCRRHNKE